MHYPIFIEPGDGHHAFGVAVPDLPVCFSAGVTLDAALRNAREAVATWLESALDHGASLPRATTVEAHSKHYPGWIASVVEIDLADLQGEPEQIGIDLPSRVIRCLDAQAEKAHVDRSAWIAKLVLQKI